MNRIVDQGNRIRNIENPNSLSSLKKRPWSSLSRTNFLFIEFYPSALPFGLTGKPSHLFAFNGGMNLFGKYVAFISRVSLNEPDS